MKKASNKKDKKKDENLKSHFDWNSFDLDIFFREADKLREAWKKRELEKRKHEYAI